MLTRLSAMTPINTRGMWIGTFHGLCNRMLRAHYRDAELPQLFQILDTQDQLALIKRLYKAHNIDDERFPPRQLQYFINDAKEEGLRPNAGRGAATTSRAGRSSITRCTTRCASAKAWSISPSCCCAATSCWRGNDGLREHYRRRFSHILVDEFQDTNALQYKWLQAAGRAADARCSRSATTTSRSTRFAAPTSPTCSISSATSRAGRAGAADQARAELPLARPHPRRRQRADQATTRRGSARTCGPSEGKGEPVRAFAAPTDIDEAAFIVDVVKGLVDDGVALDEIALLYRCNAQSRVLEHALFNAGMPYRVYGGMRFFERAGDQARARLPAPDRRRRTTTARSCASSISRRAASARARSSSCRMPRARQARRCGRRRAPARSTGKAGTALAAFVRLIEAMRATRRGRCRCRKRSST